jgi:hypothetical protein
VYQAKYASPPKIMNMNFWCLTPLSAILWRPVLVMEEAGVPGENHRQIKIEN